jgi:CheY-like chemotaxis protein
MQAADLDALIVDDHEAMRAILKRTLSMASVTRIREATNGARALAALEARPANLILADYAMPMMDGCSFVRAVRADPRFAGARIVIITGHAEESHAEAARAAGADAVMIKPISPRELLRTLETLWA